MKFRDDLTKEIFVLPVIWNKWLYIDAANGKVNPIPETVRDVYVKDVDMLRLSTHLNMLLDIVTNNGNLPLHSTK